MKLRVSVLYEIARIGFILSLITHIATFENMNLQEDIPVVWWLHFGIFLVWVPTVMIAWGYVRNMGWHAFRSMVFRLAPPWMKSLTILLILYGIANFLFVFYALNEGGAPAEKNGQYVLESSKGTIRSLTYQEYQKHQTYSVRSFSGHWMTFYFLCMVVLYAVRANEQRSG